MLSGTRVQHDTLVALSRARPALLSLLGLRPWLVEGLQRGAVAAGTQCCCSLSSCAGACGAGSNRRAPHAAARVMLSLCASSPALVSVHHGHHLRLTAAHSRQQQPPVARWLHRALWAIHTHPRATRACSMCPWGAHTTTPAGRLLGGFGTAAPSAVGPPPPPSQCCWERVCCM